MKDYITEAIVLGIKPYRETDREVQLYTKDFGRITAKVIAGRKPLSKFSPHLDVLNLVTVRLVKKEGFTITDALTENRFSLLRQNRGSLRRALELAFIVKIFAPFHVSDLNLWHSLIRVFKKAFIDFGFFLKIFGYDPKAAKCENCGDKEISYFSLIDHSYLCANCRTKIPLSELLLVR
ncbi:MAG: recombination protein O N-terminal domain-containing protein [Patescibacteria group bacterium]|nr:recombination protein O N-terminal domain-containing protein [Patescibacteria group bacterium]